MSREEISPLQDAIRNLEGCSSSWVEAVPVTERMGSETVWDGVVQVFALEGHPSAARAYAWSYATGEGEKRKFTVVLHKPPVDSPEAAVRAAIAAEYHDRAKQDD